MGVSCALRVVLSKTTYHPGEIIEGTAILNVDKPIHGAVVVASLVCREGMWWSDGDAIPHAHFQTLSETQLALTRVNTAFTTGEFTFPVKWTLSATLPRHFRVVYDETKHVIWSSVAATVFRAGKNKPVCHATQTFEVIQPRVHVPRPLSKSVLQSESRRCRRFGSLLSDGTCALEVELHSDVLDAATPLRLRIQLTNTSCKTVVKFFTVCMWRKLQITTPSKNWHSSICLKRWDLTSRFTAGMIAQAPLQTDTVTRTEVLMSGVADSESAWTHKSPNLDVSFSIQVDCFFGVLSSNIKLTIPVVVVEDRVQAP